MLFVVILPNDALNSFNLLYKISTVDEMTEEQREAYNNIYDILNFSEIDDNDDEFNDYIFED